MIERRTTEMPPCKAEPEEPRADHARFSEVERLLVVSHVMHYRHGGQLWAYGPYAREIDIWADLFAQVTIASPCRDETPPGDCIPFTRDNIAIAPQPATGGERRVDKLRQLAMLPVLFISLARAMRRADAVHVRCPGNLGLLGSMLSRLFSSYRVAKYAGQWNGYKGERLAVWLQRAILKSRWWNAPVTVYGSWPDQPPHVCSFFTSMMTSEQIRESARVAAGKRLSQPLRVLFSGRLAPEKRVDALLQGLALATRSGAALEVVVVGDGPQREQLHALAETLNVAPLVRFIGAVPFEESLRWYQWAECLVLPSTNSEGWPKVIAEAMCHGVLCIGVEHGQLPAMLEGRGVLLKSGSPAEISASLLAIVGAPDDYLPLMRAASQWARQYSLEGMLAALAALLRRHWKLPDAQAVTWTPGENLP